MTDELKTIMELHLEDGLARAKQIGDMMDMEPMRKQRSLRN